MAFGPDPAAHADNGIWAGWGWTYLNLDHPREFKYWLSFVELYDYQGPIVGYVPEHFNFIDPDKVADGSFQSRRDSQFPFGTFATLGSEQNQGIANEFGASGAHLWDDIYIVPIPQVPTYKDREYVVANFQSIEPDVMEAYSSALKADDNFDSLIDTDFLRFNGVHSSTHSHLKIIEQVGGEEHYTMTVPPYAVGYDSYNGYVEWDTSSARARRAREEENGFLYYRKLSDKWQVENGASDQLKNHQHIYTSELIMPPDEVHRVPRVNLDFNNYEERNAGHPDFASWDTTGKTRYEVMLQNGSTATYVWVKFTEQPAFQAAQQNWPEVYTAEYLSLLQTYIETLHRKVNQESTVNPADPVFINYRNAANTNHLDPRLARIDPAQLVEPPAGMEVGHVPVVISVYHPDGFSSSGSGLANQPDSQCSNASWTDSYFPDIP